jgi:hypothetical protein
VKPNNAVASPLIRGLSDRHHPPCLIMNKDLDGGLQTKTVLSCLDCAPGVIVVQDMDERSAALPGVISVQENEPVARLEICWLEGQSLRYKDVSHWPNRLVVSCRVGGVGLVTIARSNLRLCTHSRTPRCEPPRMNGLGKKCQIP